MALNPIDDAHALQIQAGILGRKTGHEFEDTITKEINDYCYPLLAPNPENGHLFTGDPAVLLLKYLAAHENIDVVVAASAISTGALATSEAGKRWLSINGANVSRCKSDIVVMLTSDDGRNLTIGVSTKQCNNDTPTNAQLYFTTARGFSNLLSSNCLSVSAQATYALRQFCGDTGFRPCDDPLLEGRQTDPRRFFWEEIEADGRKEWENTLSKHQDEVSLLLLQKAYVEDKFTPDYLIHKTRRAPSWKNTEVAIFSIPELVLLSRQYQGFVTKPYSVRKGTYKDPPGIEHRAPRFGVIQMQRGGQKQHPDQLQFNLEAGYFYKLL